MIVWRGMRLKVKNGVMIKSNVRIMGSLLSQSLENQSRARLLKICRPNLTLKLLTSFGGSAISCAAPTSVTNTGKLSCH